jgi:hypothetical protein
MALPPLSFHGSFAPPLSPEHLQHGDLLAGKVIRTEPDGNVLIQFPGGRASVELKIAVAPGAQVFAAVQKTQSQTKFLLLSELNLQEKYTATVLSARGSEIIVQLGEAEVTVQVTGKSLPQPGSVVQVQLQMQAGKPVVRMINPPESAGETESIASGAGVRSAVLDKQLLMLVLDNGLQNTSYSLLSLLQSLPQHFFSNRPWLDSLLKLLQRTLLNPNDETFADQVEAAIKDSGVFFESGMYRSAQAGKQEEALPSDSKMVLLQALQECAKEQNQETFPPQLGQIAEKAAHLLDAVRAEQYVNVRLLSSHQFYIQLPVAPSAGFGSVEILYTPEREEKTRKSDTKNFKLTIAVSTAKLGKMKADISLISRLMTCQFKTDRRWVADLIEKHAENLKQRLEAFDYRIAHIGCVVTTADEELSLVPGILQTGAGGVNICV